MNKVNDDIEIIYKRCISGETQEAIADDYEVPACTISQSLLKYCVYNNKDRIKKKVHNIKLTPEDIKVIIKEYVEKKSTVKELAARYHVSESTIRHYLPIMEKTPKPKNIDDKEEQIVDEVIQLYESGKSIQVIKDKLNISSRDIRIILMNYMDIKDGKISLKSIELLKKQGYNIALIKKVAQDRGMEVEEQKLTPSQDDDVQL